MYDKFLFPEIEPYNSGFLKVSDVHSVYFEESGNPKGRPVVYLHGGPGAGSSPRHRRLFDPDFYRIILFDQRGCGRSIPFLELKENTTWDLVADMEKLREHLGIEKWLVCGGSWGSTLSLFYAETHPQRVIGMILRGIFLARPFEYIDTFQKNAIASKFFPEEFERFINYIPEEERGNLIAAYYKRFLSQDTQIRDEAAVRYFTWECTICTLLPEEINFDLEKDKYVISEALLEGHYFVNRFFCENDNHILSEIEKVKNIPSIIIQGRYDMCCPPISAYNLYKAMPKSKFVVVPNSHVIWEPCIQEEHKKAQEEFKSLF